jgi:hypothetical protein
MLLLLLWCCGCCTAVCTAVVAAAGGVLLAINSPPACCCCLLSCCSSFCSFSSPLFCDSCASSFPAVRFTLFALSRRGRPVSWGRRWWYHFGSWCMNCCTCAPPLPSCVCCPSTLEKKVLKGLAGVFYPPEIETGFAAVSRNT